MIKRIAHVCLNVSDLAKTIAFYRDALGLRVQFTFDKKGTLFGAYFAAGNMTFIEAFEKKDLRPVNTGIVHICLETDDIDEAIRTLTGKGVPCTPKKLGSDHSWQSWIKDPDGNSIELHHYTPDSLQLKGGVAEVNW
jgi:catechol 2,3-dioxygenase-like lactoylglutathione lyase family enzyme